MWLCDIAVALEARSDDFDWERCLGQDRHRADAIACALGLAHQLLEARIDDTPIAQRARALPSWLVPAVLRQWETPLLSQHQVPELMSSLLQRGQIVRALRERWPNAIEATVTQQASFDRPPVVSQVHCFTQMSWNFLKRVPQTKPNANKMLP